MKIPFHIVSGFLGSGKTTLLKRIIESYSDKMKLGIIQNEFANSNIDGVELKSTGKDFHLLEINKGSVFCVCLLGDFSRSLENFINEHQPDVLILECSGLSDTTAVSEVISSGRLNEKVYLATNWCVVDTLNFVRAGLMAQRIAHQIRMADVILLNKAAIPKDTGQAERAVRELNPYAETVNTVYCNMEVKLGDPSVEKLYSAPINALGRPEVNSMVIKSGRKTTLEKAVEFLQQWAGMAYRIKGYINLKNGNTLAVQCVCGDINCSEIAGSYYSSELIALTDRFTLHEWNRSFRSIT
jgi:G3E family GTPase